MTTLGFRRSKAGVVRELGMFVATAFFLSACTPDSTAPVTPPTVHPIALSAVDTTNGWDKLYLVDPDGTNLRMLALGAQPPRFRSLSWAPDGRRFAASADGAIYIVDTASAVAAKLSLGDGVDRTKNEVVTNRTPAWSPDGTRIAFAQLRQTYQEENANNPASPSYTLQICIAPVDASDVACLPLPSIRATSPAWSPDGRRLVFAAEPPSPTSTAASPSCPMVLYVADANGTNAHAITSLTPDMQCGTYFQGDATPAWSPDGRRIAFVSDRQRGNYRSALGPAFDHVYVVDSSGANLQQLTQTPPAFAVEVDASPSWSADGRLIAYSHEAYTTAGKADREHGLYVMHADGSNAVRIIAGPTLVSAVAWSHAR